MHTDSITPNTPRAAEHLHGCADTSSEARKALRAEETFNTGTRAELDLLHGYKVLCESAFYLMLNCNDTFAWASADAQMLDGADLKWAVPIAAKYGFEGVIAIMAYLRGMKEHPIREWSTPEFAAAINELWTSCPAISTDRTEQSNGERVAVLRAALARAVEALRQDHPKVPEPACPGCAVLTDPIGRNTYERVQQLVDFTRWLSGLECLDSAARARSKNCEVCATCRGRAALAAWEKP